MFCNLACRYICIQLMWTECLCPSKKLYGDALTPKVMVFRAGAFVENWIWMTSWGWDPHDGIWCPYKRRKRWRAWFLFSLSLPPSSLFPPSLPDSLPFPLPSCPCPPPHLRTQWESSLLKARNRASTRNWTLPDSDLGLARLQNCKKTNICG